MLSITGSCSGKYWKYLGHTLCWWTVPPISGGWLLFSYSVMSNSLWPCGLQHARFPCPSPSPGVCSNSRPLSWWCHQAISSPFVPFSSLLQSFPGGTIGKEPTCWYRWFKRCRFSPWVGKIPWSRKCNPLQYSCLENPHGQRSPAGYSSQGCKDLDATEAT